MVLRGCAGLETGGERQRGPSTSKVFIEPVAKISHFFGRFGAANVDRLEHGGEKSSKSTFGKACMIEEDGINRCMWYSWPAKCGHLKVIAIRRLKA